jgi:hypothetical protein
MVLDADTQPVAHGPQRHEPLRRHRPPGSFTASGTRRSFTFSDPTLVHSGIRTAKLIVASAGVVKYSFEMKGLDEPPFLGGTGMALVEIDDRCFVDMADSCTLSASGTSARCQ